MWKYGVTTEHSAFTYTTEHLFMENDRKSSMIVAGQPLVAQ
jgi:hypothetical protein